MAPTQQHLLLTVIFATNCILFAAGICSWSSLNRSALLKCPDVRTIVWATAAATGYDGGGDGGSLSVAASLAPWAPGPGEAAGAWRLRVQVTETEEGGAQTLALARRCPVSTPAADPGPDRCIAATLPLAARPGQHLWVWAELLAREGDVGCSFCKAKPLAVEVQAVPTLPPSPSSPPSLPPCIGFSFIAAFGSTFAAFSVVILLAACFGLLLCCRRRHYSVSLHQLQLPMPFQEVYCAEEHCGPAPPESASIQRNTPCRVPVDQPASPPAPPPPSAPPATPPPPPLPSRTLL